MARKVSLSVLLVASFVFVLSFQNCSNDYKLTAIEGPKAASLTGDPGATGDPGGPGGPGPGPGPTGTLTQDCHDFDAVSSPLKILVVVDDSGSTDTTDPNKVFRKAVLNGFVDKYASFGNFQWNLMQFSGTSATSYINTNGASSVPTFANSTVMKNAIADYVLRDSNANTPYKAALQLITSAISNDSDLNKPGSPMNYVIVFLSDGQPTDLGTPPDAALLKSLVQNVVGLSSGHITLSSVFFDAGTATADSAAANFLRAMATDGGGQFAYTAAGGSNLSLGMVATLPSAICKK